MPGLQPKEPKDFGRKSPADRPTALSVVLYLSLQNATLFVKNETGPGSGGKLFCVPGTDQSEKGLACPAAAPFLPHTSNNFKDASIVVGFHPLWCSIRHTL